MIDGAVLANAGGLDASVITSLLHESRGNKAI
jgi:argininosuccinate synthase